MDESTEAIALDVARVGRIDAVPTLLRVLCEITGMGFAAVARVTDGSWTACAVCDRIEFGLVPGSPLDVHTTLCKEVRLSGAPVVIEQASTDPRYCGHPTMTLYALESYVSVPIVLPGGAYFGNLCAIDRVPAPVGGERIAAMFRHFAELIGHQIEGERRRELVQAALLDQRAAAELREQLVAILGHDLRASIGAVALDSQRLRAPGGVEPTAVAAIAVSLDAQVKRATALIDNVLDFARGQLGGGLGVAPVAVERVDEALFGVVSELQAAHPGRDIEWSFDVDGPVWVDRGRLQQVAVNLLGNALAHAEPPGRVTLSARTTPDELVLEVWNEGRPIAPALLPKLFAPFWRAQAPARREGLGLGLHICAQIVRAHHGQIAVVSTAEAGTTVTVRMPRGG